MRASQLCSLQPIKNVYVSGGKIIFPCRAPRRTASATHFKPSRAMAINQLHITYSSQILLTYNYAHTGLAGNSQRAQPTSRCASSKIQTLFHSKLVRPACRAGHTGGPAGRGTAAAAVAAAAGQAATLYQSVQQYYITQYCNHPGQQPSSSSSSSPILPMLFSALQCGSGSKYIIVRN